ncbi:SusC/RagA family TonB-linked outer membrane protein [Reichenbachiella carrageenanivorans]|uniref:SusC/RagA family TonB-linked outer membrane protein n=1 Tax=Reichenbachiella carrageenanivorans TaxID=2979869 RepID=A0ABY6D2A3_9BACT|nr:SusC/RagA family TonB-linked outer membrane protein [Reichenbachiella carrageenanivorans]UXX79879.1 SusC/RagA family TonB-linked outer membrane protein [Reichenbachiella carrageenanivorans]
MAKWSEYTRFLPIVSEVRSSLIVRSVHSIAWLWAVSFSVSYAQIKDHSNSAQIVKKTSLGEILDQIASQYQVDFVYESEVVNRALGEFEIDAQGEIETVLTQLLSPLHLRFIKVSDNIYAIKFDGIPHEKVVISGIVRTHTGNQVLPGVSVRSTTSNVGTITDVDGQFSVLLDQNSDERLTFSYVGYEKTEVKLGDATYLEVQLKQDDLELSEVVVVASGMNGNKRELGYSVQNVDLADVIQSHESNLVSALSAKAAGVNVIGTSGSPGASANIQIRGYKSINSSNQPLFVLDGMIISNTTSGNTSGGVDVSNRVIDINPHDINKITILKGPAATVLYGSRAANGAVMINTNRGTESKTRIAFYSETGFSKVNKLPAKQRTYAQGRPYTGVFVYRGPETGEPNSYGPRIDQLEYDGDTSYPYDTNGSLVPIGTGNGKPANSYDDYDAFWVTGYRLDNNISFTGGSNLIKYYFSLGHLFQSGIIPTSTFVRTSMKANIDFDLTSKWRVGVSTSLVNSGGERVRRGSNVSGVTAALYRNTTTFDIGNGKTGKSASNDPTSYQLPNGEQRAYRGNALYDNPFWVTNKIPYTDKVNRVIANTHFSYDWTSWLFLTAKIGIDNYIDSRDSAWDINSSSEPSGRVDQSTLFSRRYNVDFNINLNKDLSPKFSLQSTIGYNYYSQLFEAKTTTGTDLAIYGFYDISNATQVISDREINRSKLVGVFADVKLSYQDYLFLQLAGRNDWSSTLPKKNNAYFYPAASLAIDLAEGLRMSSSAISQVKLRGSYGLVGNDPTIYQTQDSYRNTVIDGDGILSSSEFPAFNVNAFERNGRKGNDELLPEVTKTIELGTDLGLFNHTWNIDVTYYKAITSDALVTVTLPGPSGYTSIVENSGEIENKGLEIATQMYWVDRKDWTWTTNLNYTRNRSMVRSLGENIERVTLAEFSNISSINLVGQPFGVFSGTRYRRDDQNRLVIGSDGFPLIDTEQGLIGDPNPDWTLGISNRFRYKSLTLSILWDIKKGGDMWNGTKGVMDYLGISKESGDLREVKDYVFDGVLANGQVNDIPVDFANPALGLNGIYWRIGGFLGVAENNIEDASWARLRELTLDFELPRNWIEDMKIFSSLNVSLYGRNLWLITDYSGIDPETNLYGPSNAQGWDYFNLPNTKSYGFVLNAKFN